MKIRRLLFEIKRRLSAGTGFGTCAVECRHSAATKAWGIGETGILRRSLKQPPGDKGKLLFDVCTQQTRLKFELVVQTPEAHCVPAVHA